VLEGLAAYVRALRPEACERKPARIGLQSRLARVDRAMALAEAESGETRRLLLAAARSQLGEIDERFAIPGGEPARSLLRAADREVGALRAGSGDWSAWRRHWPGWRRRLLRLERNSLFDAKRLRAAIGPQHPVEPRSIR
jgi:hypothetical protein